jgi:hypothetical protein
MNINDDRPLSGKEKFCGWTIRNTRKRKLVICGQYARTLGQFEEELVVTQKGIRSGRARNE